MEKFCGLVSKYQDWQNTALDGNTCICSLRVGGEFWHPVILSLFLPLVLTIIFSSMPFSSPSSSPSPILTLFFRNQEGYLQSLAFHLLPELSNRTVYSSIPSIWLPFHLTHSSQVSIIPFWIQLILRAEEPQAVGKSGNFEGRSVVSVGDTLRSEVQAESEKGFSMHLTLGDLFGFFWDLMKMRGSEEKTDVSWQFHSDSPEVYIKKLKSKKQWPTIQFSKFSTFQRTTSKGASPIHKCCKGSALIQSINITCT